MNWNIMGALMLVAFTLNGQNVAQQRARIVGGGGPNNGKCTIEVDVDDIAEVEIIGDVGRLRTLAGGPAIWRRFQCTGPMPPNPVDFRFSGVDGRGRQFLLRDPRNYRGVAVIRIEDPKGGREGYTFDLEWRGDAGGGGYDRRGRDDRDGRFGGPPPSRITTERAVTICQDVVVERLERDGFRGVRFERTVLEDNPDRRDWIVGMADARRRDDLSRFSFSCSVDFSSGRVRSVDVRRR